MWRLPSLQAALGRPTLNLAFGSDGTEQVLWRLQTFDWSRQHPDYVFLLVGTDDMRFPTCPVLQGVLAVVRKAHSVFPDATIIVTSILPRGDDLRVRDSEIVSINQQLAAAAQRDRFLFFDAHDAFLCGHHTPCPLYLPGNLHLTPAGYQVLSDMLHRFLLAR
jgi:platelet-activating factor acetylhydrolase IB subunit beta/gamma